MIKKLKSKRGFSLAELLVVLAIMVLVGTAIAVGISSGGRVLNDVTNSSEANILCGTIAIELADELRFAESIEGDSFTSRRFGINAKIESTDGRVTIGGNQLLSAKSYGELKADVAVTRSGNSFDVKIEIKQGEALCAQAEFSITPLSLTSAA